MSHKNKNHIILPSDIIEVYNEIKEMVSSHGVNILNKEGISTCNDFVDMCYRYIPRHSTDLSQLEYMYIQKSINDVPNLPLFKSNSYTAKKQKQIDENDWKLVK